MTDPATPAPPPALPPVPVPEGEFRGVKASLDRIEKALALQLQTTLDLKKAYDDAKPILDQVKAKFVDPKSGKIKSSFWPF